MFLSRFLAVAGVAGIVAGCAGASKTADKLWLPIPDQAPDSSSNVRGNAAAAGMLSNRDQLQIVTYLISDFYQPMNKQVRWFDPRPLAHVRSVADDSAQADPDFADEVISQVKNRRICVLDWRDAECRGKTGGIIRVSWPYLVGRDSAIIYSQYIPRDSTGALQPGKTEMQFRLKWSRSEEYWNIAGKTTVVAPDTVSAKTAKP